MNSMLWLIWTIFVCIQYFKYSNGWDIVFEWHMWMFMIDTQNSHSFKWIYITIIAQIYLKCKLYVLHIKTSYIKKTSYIYLCVCVCVCVIFSLWSPQILHKHIFYDFCMDSIEISWCWKKIMNIYEFDNERKTYDLINWKKHDRML